MDMDETEENEATTSLFRFRSPTFQLQEVKLLVQLVEKYKYDILNKSTNSAANHAKEQAWSIIAKEYNRQGLGLERSMDVLKTKWENLKRNARKLAKDIMDEECPLNKDEIYKTVLLICNAENGMSDSNGQKHVNDVEDGRHDIRPWACDDGNDSSFYNTLDGEHKNETPKKCEVPSSFSPRDCQLLLRCVRQEKNILFSKASVVKRHQAWKRIADNYNRKSPRKKTSKELNRKFNNMKAMARKVNIKGYFQELKRKKYQPLRDDVKIKSEPIMDSATDFEFDSDDNKVLSNPVEQNNHFNQDPLNNAHNSDSGIGSISNNKDIARLKAELINYKMETARLERKRIEDAIKADEMAREMRAVEQSLRLRAARLEALAAEAKLSPSHAGLSYTAEEAPAKEYLCNSHLDIG